MIALAADPVEDRLHRVVDREDEAGRALRRLLEADVEPDRRVERRVLVDEDRLQLGLEGLGLLVASRSSRPACPSADGRVDDAADHLLDAALALGRGHAAAEVLLRDDVRRGLRPELRELDVPLLERRAALARDQRIAGLPLDLVERVAPRDREVPLRGDARLLVEDAVDELLLFRRCLRRLRRLLRGGHAVLPGRDVLITPRAGRARARPAGGPGMLGRGSDGTEIPANSRKFWPPTHTVDSTVRGRPASAPGCARPAAGAATSSTAASVARTISGYGDPGRRRSRPRGRRRARAGWVRPPRMGLRRLADARGVAAAGAERRRGVRRWRRRRRSRGGMRLGRRPGSPRGRRDAARARAPRSIAIARVGVLEDVVGKGTDRRPVAGQRIRPCRPVRRSTSRGSPAERMSSYGPRSAGGGGAEHARDGGASRRRHARQSPEGRYPGRRSRNVGAAAAAGSTERACSGGAGRSAVRGGTASGGSR